MKKRFKPLFLILSVIIILELVILSKNSKPVSTTKATTLQQYADQILTKCSRENYRQGCYDENIPKLMDHLSMEEAFMVTKLVQDKDQTYQYCHVLGHKLSAREVSKNPSKWKETVSRCPSGMCSNGCIHGGFQEKFRVESLTDEQLLQVKEDLKIICEKRDNWNPTGLEQASCYHALGHLTMYLTSADINKSVKLCEEIALKNDGRDFQQLCFDGAFMQIFQPLEPEDFALVKGKQPTKDQILFFCGDFNGHQKASCLSESWPLFRQELISDPNELVKFCQREEPNEQQRCFGGMFYVLTAQFNFDTDKIQAYCLGLPANKQGLCFANAASRMIETDYRNISKSVSLCSSAPSFAQNECFNELIKYSSYNFHTKSKEFFELCNSLPDPWKDSCVPNAP